MAALAIFVRIINQLNEWIGRTVSWLTLGVVLVCFSVVVLRYVFNIGFVWMQDIYVWLHAIAFTLGRRLCPAARPSRPGRYLLPASQRAL